MRTHEMEDTTLRFAARVTSPVIILIVLWALGILQPGRSVVY